MEDTTSHSQKLLGKSCILFPPGQATSCMDTVIMEQEERHENKICKKGI